MTRNSIKLITENSKWESPPLWVWIGLNGIFSLWDISEVDFKRKKTEKWLSRSVNYLQHVKNVLPCTSQIRHHQLLATPLLLDWSIEVLIFFFRLIYNQLNQSSKNWFFSDFSKFDSQFSLISWSKNRFWNYVLEKF